VNLPVVLFRLLCVATFLFAVFTASPVQAGWNHRYGCGSCGSHRHHRDLGSHGSSGGSASASAPAPIAKKVAWFGPADGAMLAIELPTNAKLYINGSLTSLTGGLRYFAASGLADDKQYQYDVKMVLDGQDKTQERMLTVWLVAGEQQTVLFDDAQLNVIGDLTPAVATNLTLRVPADSKVWIEGQLTTHTGPVRQFSTGLLDEGQEWAGYEIRVATVIDGREVAVVKKITLTGGQDLILAIDPALPPPAIEATASVRR